MGGSIFSLLLLLIVAAVVVGGIVSMRRASLEHEKNRALELESQIAESKRAAEEDVTVFGEELQRLDSDVAGHRLDESMQQDYTRALDNYDHAKQALDQVKDPQDVGGVTEILADGRYAVACVKARLAGEPLPQKRPPCFFNPQHGPSSENVDWTPPGGTQRSVPACPADAERVLAGADPYVRTVAMGARRVPYWEGGPAYQPYAQGYYRGFQGSDMLTGMMMGGLLFGGMNMLGGMFGGHGGYGGDMGGGMFGGGDPGGMGGDPGGGLFGGDGGGFFGGDGGGDFGGGDFGGGDFF